MDYGRSMLNALTRLLDCIVKVECKKWEEIFCETATQMVTSNRKRIHATGFHAPRKYKWCAEVSSVRSWVEERNKRGWKIVLDSIQKNRESYPDCLARMDGKEIGIEVTEMVDRNAIGKQPSNLAYQGPEHFLHHFVDPPIVKWNSAKIERHLQEIVQRKDMRVWSRNRSLFLLIVADEPWLDGDTLDKYLDGIELPRPRNLDGVYVMRDYVPNASGDGHGYCPVSEVRLAE